MANLFAGSPGKNGDTSLPAVPPPLHTRSSQQNDPYNDRPSTPIRNNFTTPVSTPQGSPSKNRNPPGAIDLPEVFSNAMKLNPGGYDSPLKLGRPLQTGGILLTPGKGNGGDEYYSSNLSGGDESVLHKSQGQPGSPLRKQANENTPPIPRAGIELGASHNLAAQQRQQGYQPTELTRENSTPTIRKYNTARGLTPEELEILQKPNVKRLANVTQLCRLPLPWIRM